MFHTPTKSSSQSSNQSKRAGEEDSQSPIDSITVNTIKKTLKKFSLSLLKQKQT